jgi:hypothetical protein
MHAISADERRTPMNSDPDRTVRILSLFLGISTLAFGVLKFVDPFHTWFGIQIAKSNLPAPSFGLGIAGEIAIGLALIAPWVTRKPLEPYRRGIWALSSVGLIVMMLVATYVHLHPDVPADVLPLKIKPPVIPLSFLGLAVFNLVSVLRSHESRPSARS